MPMKPYPKPSTAAKRTRLAGLAAFALAFVVVTGALAQDSDEERKVRAPDPAKGLVLAQRWCASCHVVAPDQRSAVDGVASFESIARRTNFNGEKLAFFLLNPHPVMPNMALTRDEAGDIAAYIARLRK